MNLLQAIEETIAGKEDRSGVTMVDMYISKVMNSIEHTQKEKCTEIQSVIDANLSDIERKWFLLTSAITKWGLESEELSESIRNVLAEETSPLPPMAKYHGLRAMGIAAGGLLPKDIENESTLRRKSPKLWAELFLSAYQNGNPKQISMKMIQLIEGDTPLMPWKSLRALFPEMRKAYGSASEFRKQIQIVADQINDHVARQDLLDAAEKRVGGGISEIDKKEKERRRNPKRNFNIPIHAIHRDSFCNQKTVDTNGQLTLEAA